MDVVRRIVGVTGPTATGKTTMAVRLCRQFGGEVISVDSRQVYRGLDIGTGKDREEYGSGDDSVPVHLIDIADPMEDYNLMRFAEDAEHAVDSILTRAHLPVLAGGTGLYLHAYLRNYELRGGPPQIGGLREALRERDVGELLEMVRKRIPGFVERHGEGSNRSRLIRILERSEATAEALSEPISKRNPPLASLVLGVLFPRKETHRRIEERLDRRLREGMIEEVERLQQNGIPWERFDYFGLEYRWVALYLQGKIERDQMRLTLLAKIRQFARRQDAWFRKMERDGIAIHWIPEGRYDTAAELVETFLAGKPVPGPEIRLDDIRYGPRHR